MAISRQRFSVIGIVQGVGFRPFVARLATSLDLAGWVRNTSSAVEIEVEGPADSLAAFAHRLESEAPPAASIEHIDRLTIPCTNEPNFAIHASQATAVTSVGIPADLAICPACLAEMRDPADRRYRYPFINCTLCGPRYSIITGLPYDRPFTSMRVFPMCAACRAEYEDPTNRRYHAQPISCPDCGPELAGLNEAITRLKGGQIVAIRGIGGFHLACDARNPAAVALLRERKGRGDQPFAVMARNLDVARTLAHISEQEAALLASPASPIVLVTKRTPEHSIAPGNGYLGIMLPYAPLHHLLLEDLDLLVMTSGNRHGEPIATANDEARRDLAHLADFFLTHNRDIVTHADDSVVRVLDRRMLAIRRGRGHAPLQLRLPVPLPPTLAVGAELKAACALAADTRVYQSQHIGDMENLGTLACFERTVQHLSSLYRIEPQQVIHDAHPGYLSTQWATRSGLPTKAVQHHRAHVASVLAEYQIAPDEPVVAAIYDGTGLGDDNAIWGGEVFLGPLTDLQRVAHLPYVSLPGGDSAARKPAVVAAAHLAACGIEWQSTPAGAALTAEHQRVLTRQLARGLNCHQSSSMGRLFDAAASLLDIRHQVDYEAQAAIELEALATRWPHDEAYDATPWRLDELWPQLLADQAPVEARARRFHGAIATWTIRTLAPYGRRVVLSGGVFQNVLLLRLVMRGLDEVLVPRYLPPNDGGLALGQLYLAAVS